MVSKLQSVYLTLYRLISFVFLLTMVGGILFYGIMVGFFAGSNSWGAPALLSPTHASVLSYQPQVVNLQTTINKQTIELQTAKSTMEILKAQHARLYDMLGRLQSAQEEETSISHKSNKELGALVRQKSVDTEMLNQSVQEAKERIEQINGELEAGLITADVAAKQKTTLRAIIAQATNSSIELSQLTRHVDNVDRSVNTMKGRSLSVAALAVVRQQDELLTNLGQVEVELQRTESTITALQQSVQDNTRVLETAMRSPLYDALRAEVSVAFVPYENLTEVEIGASVYDCALRIFFCSDVGKVEQIYIAEQYAKHPMFNSEMKGRFVRLSLTDQSASTSKVVFIDGRPLDI